MGYDYAPYAEDIASDNELTKQLRVPIVSNPYPRWRYLTAVVVGDLYAGQMPTDHELRQIASYTAEYIEHWYNEGYKKKLRERPYDVDGGANGVVFIKRADGGWGYRRRSWISGPQFVPTWQDEPTDLITVMDQVRTIVGEISKRWVDWKAAHPEVFAPAATHFWACPKPDCTTPHSEPGDCPDHEIPLIEVGADGFEVTT